MADSSWRERAHCLRKNPNPLSHDNDAFKDLESTTRGGIHATNQQAYVAFKKRCHSHCLVRTECLQEAMRLEGAAGSQNRHGIWGGKTPGEREELHLHGRTET